MLNQTNQNELFNYVSEPYHHLADNKMPIDVVSAWHDRNQETDEIVWHFLFDYADIYDEPQFTMPRVDWHSASIDYSTKESLSFEEVLDKVFSPKFFKDCTPVVFKPKSNSFRIDGVFLYSNKCDWKIELLCGLGYFALPPIEAVIESVNKYILESGNEVPLLDESDSESLAYLYAFYSLLLYSPADKKEWQWLIKHYASFKQIPSCVDPLYGETLTID